MPQYNYRANLTIQKGTRKQRVSCYVDDSHPLLQNGVETLWVLGSLDTGKPFRVIKPADLICVNFVTPSKGVQYTLSDILEEAASYLLPK